jgi:hypothetical protein
VADLQIRARSPVPNEAQAGTGFTAAEASGACEYGARHAVPAPHPMLTTSPLANVERDATATKTKAEPKKARGKRLDMLDLQE